MERYWEVLGGEDNLVIDFVVRCLSSVLAALYDLIILGLGEFFCSLIKSFGRVGVNVY